jgi:hypothetical protein
MGETGVCGGHWPTTHLKSERLFECDIVKVVTKLAISKLLLVIDEREVPLV